MVGGGRRGVMLRGWAGWGAERAHGLAMSSFPHIILSFPQNVRNGNWERGCEGKYIRRSRVKVVEGGFPCISAQGYIIISKVKI